jgi:Trypsin
MSVRPATSTPRCGVTIVMSRCIRVAALAAAAVLSTAALLLFAPFSSVALADTPPEFYDVPGQVSGAVDPATPTGPVGTVGGKDGPVPTSPAQPQSRAPTTGQGAQPGSVPKGAPARPTTRCARTHTGLTCRTYAGRRLLRSCTTRGKGRHRVRACRIYDATGRLASTCTKAGRKKVKCHTVKHGRKARSAADMGRNATVVQPVVRFYKNGSGWCSGTLLTRGIVLTAAHCLVSNGSYYNPTSLIVTPANQLSTSGAAVAPYGNFHVRRSIVPQGYYDGTDIGLDWGFVEVSADANGWYPGDYTGTYSATWNADVRSEQVLSRTGYPGELPFTNPANGGGNVQYHCNAPWSGRHEYFGSSYALYDEPCEMNGGSSGGPVFWYDASAGKWTIVGVNNRAARDPQSNIGLNALSFYFNSNFGTFWSSMLSIWYG